MEQYCKSYPVTVAIRQTVVLREVHVDVVYIINVIYHG